MKKRGRKSSKKFGRRNNLDYPDNKFVPVSLPNDLRSVTKDEMDKEPGVKRTILKLAGEGNQDAISLIWDLYKCKVLTPKERNEHVKHCKHCQKIINSNGPERNKSPFFPYSEAVR